MSQVAVVTDTTHYAPRALLQAHDIREVSLYVNLGDRHELHVTTARVPEAPTVHVPLLGPSGIAGQVPRSAFEVRPSLCFWIGTGPRRISAVCLTRRGVICCLRRRRTRPMSCVVDAEIGCRL